jgi:hypothetical protein
LAIARIPYLKNLCLALFLPVLNVSVFRTIGGTRVLKTLAQWMNINNQEDDGAVTVDWVVLTSAVAGLSLAVILSISNGAQVYATFVNEDLEEIAYDVGHGD